MFIYIYIQVEKDKVKFILNLPFELIDLNEKQYYLLDDITVYESNKINVDNKILDKNIKAILYRIKNTFFKNTNINDINVNFIINDDDAINEKDIYDFIKENKNLNIDFGVSNYKRLIDNLKDGEYPYLKINFKNSDKSIPYAEFHKMFLMLNRIIQFINHYNLSPLEKVLLVYDIVKSNKYKRESQNEGHGKSRNLNEIINGDKIVCVGFSNLMDFLLTNLGFRSKITVLKYENSKIGHQRNCIYLKDTKYNIDGVFFLDATWDSKKSENYIDNYSFFLKPLSFFKKIKKSETVMIPASFNLLQKNKEELIKEIEKANQDELIHFMIKLSKLIDIYKNNDKERNRIFCKTKEELVKIIDEIYCKYNKKISRSSFENALYKVRRIEFINKIIDFEPNEEYITSICNRYFKNQDQIELLKKLGIVDNPALDKDLKEFGVSSIDEDLLRIRLLRALKTRIQDFPQDDFIKKM